MATIHVWCNIFIAIGLIVTAIAGFGSFYSGKKISETKEKELGSKIESLLDGNKYLQEQLAPFEEYAKKRYPQYGEDEALDRLHKDIEKMKTELATERNTIRDFATRLNVTFSGKWTKSPAIQIMSPVDREYYVELNSTEDGSKRRPIKFYATQAYEFETVDKNRLIFKSRQSVHQGDYPLGKSIVELTPYNGINFHMPLIANSDIEEGKVLIEKVEVIFYVNGEERYNLSVGSSTEMPIRGNWVNFGATLPNANFATLLKSISTESQR